jgi:hypothetical protein
VVRYIFHPWYTYKRVVRAQQLASIAKSVGALHGNRRAAKLHFHFCCWLGLIKVYKSPSTISIYNAHQIFNCGSPVHAICILRPFAIVTRMKCLRSKSRNSPYIFSGSCIHTNKILFIFYCHYASIYDIYKNNTNPILFNVFFTGFLNINIE